MQQLDGNQLMALLENIDRLPISREAKASIRAYIRANASSSRLSPATVAKRAMNRVQRANVSESEEALQRFGNETFSRFRRDLLAIPEGLFRQAAEAEIEDRGLDE